jgi:hypothetical protein
MFAVEIYAAVRRFVFVEGKSRREAAPVFGLSRDTIAKMSHSFASAADIVSPASLPFGIVTRRDSNRRKQNSRHLQHAATGHNGDYATCDGIGPHRNLMSRLLNVAAFCAAASMSAILEYLIVTSSLLRGTWRAPKPVSSMNHVP